MDVVSKHIYRLLLTLVVVILAGGTIFYHFTEKWSWVDAYYFCVVTLATVGYGDLTPHTTAGKFFTTFYILTGVGIITSFITFTMKRRATIYQERRGKAVTEEQQSSKDSSP